MDSVAFVGETVSAPLPRTNLVARIVRGTGLFIGLAAFLAISVGGLMLGGVVTPFRYYDAMAVVAVAVGPALLVLAAPKLLGPGKGGPMKRVHVLCGLLVFLVLIPGNFALYANQRLDHSPAVTQVAPVLETWIKTDRHGHRSYMAAESEAVASPLGRHSFYSSQPVQLPQDEWQRLVPGQSALVLRVHRGWLRFAWFESNPTLAP